MASLRAHTDSRRRRWLGIDSGLANAGYAVYLPDENRFIACGVLTTKESEEDEAVMVKELRRCMRLHGQLAQLLFVHQPEKVLCEFPHGGAQNAIAMRKMVMAAATIMVTCQAHETPVVAISPGEIKQLVLTGSKAEVKSLVAFSYPETGDWLNNLGAKSEHAADAIACIMAFLERPKQ